MGYFSRSLTMLPAINTFGFTLGVVIHVVIRWLLKATVTACCLFHIQQEREKVSLQFTEECHTHVDLRYSGNSYELMDTGTL